MMRTLSPRIHPLFLVLVILTLGAALPLPASANPIPMPADNLWSLALNAEPLPNFLVWETNGAINVLLGLDDRIVHVRDGEIIRRGESFNGTVTALLRADVMGEERPEILVGVKEDSLNLIHIINGEDFTPLWTITAGWDWINHPEDPDSSESWEEETEYMHWIGGEENVLIIGKEIKRSSRIGFGGSMSKEGQILRYSILNSTMIDSIDSGYDQHWSVVDGEFVVGSTSWWANMEPIFCGFNQLIAQRFSSDLSGLQTITMEVGDFEGYAEINTALTASVTIRLPDDSPRLIASVDSKYAYREPSTTLKIFDATNLDSLTAIDLELRPITTFVPILNQENDQSQPYLMCIEANGTTRLLSTSTLSLLAQEYISPVGGIGVKGGDFDGDGTEELIGIRGNRLTCVRLEPLGTSPLPDFIPLPASLSLSAFPNPFNSSTTISYSLPTPGRYAIDVIDLQGRLVARLADGWKEAGSYREVWNAGPAVSGIYTIRLQSENETATRMIYQIK